MAKRSKSVSAPEPRGFWEEAGTRNTASLRRHNSTDEESDVARLTEAGIERARNAHDDDDPDNDETFLDDEPSLTDDDEDLPTSDRW